MSFHLPFELDPARGVLVAGCGGGYDVVCALPVAFALRDRGFSVHLASYAFTSMALSPGIEEPRPGLFRIHPGCQPPPDGYFPEGYLTRWWEREMGEATPVWGYRRVGVIPLAEHFEYLAAQLDLGAIVVVDAGVDALFLGHEHELGTPETDAISLLAAYRTRGWKRYFAFCAFGSEGIEHDVRHADALERIAELVRGQGALGVTALLPQSPEGKRFLQVVEFIQSRMEPHWHSTMASSLVAALEGRFGHQALTEKTRTSPVWISPLQLLYWFFRLEAVAEAKPYLARALETERVGEMQELIQQVRDQRGITPPRDIPI